jgi:hypothetical protein
MTILTACNIYLDFEIDDITARVLVSTSTAKGQIVPAGGFRS